MGGGAPQQGMSQGPGAGQPPSAAPANPHQMVLAQIYQVLKQMALENPVLSSGLTKAGEGIQEAQTAMLTQAPQPGPEQNPPY